MTRLEIDGLKVRVVTTKLTKISNKEIRKKRLERARKKEIKNEK